jgi:hypothetical protein
MTNPNKGWGIGNSSQWASGKQDDGTWVAERPDGVQPRRRAGQPISEVTSIRAAISVLEQIANAHAAHSGDEGFLGSLVRMEVGADDQAKVRAAQEASRNAGALWAQATATIRAHNDPVGQAYSTSPGAGNKAANTNE